MKEKEPKVKAPKAPKAKKQMPEGYIGRPKPMRTKKFEFHKPTTKFYVGLGIWVCVIAFITYIVIRLLNVSTPEYTNVVRYDFNAEGQPQSYVLENNKLKFELDPFTTSFTVTQKDTGVVWNSNPEGAANDAIALPKEKNNLQSPFLIKYSTINGVETIYDFFSSSIEKKVYEIQKGAKDITVNYSIGEIETVYIYPLAITEKDMDEWLEKMSKSDQRSVKSNYRKLEKGTFLPSDDVNQLMKDYPALENEAVYVIRESVQTYLKEKVQGIFESVGYTMEDFLKDQEMYAGAKAKNVPGFNVTVVYSLDGNKLVVDVPFDKIAYKTDYPIIRLDVLPYFGAGSLDDKGFLLIPEGGGSIINFNNGRTRQNNYMANVYGWDYASDRKELVTETRASFPVFGISKGDSSFISIIEKGAEYAAVAADISGKSNTFNYAYAEYKMLHSEVFEASDRNINNMYAYERGLDKDESIKQIYSFIPSGSYVDMAKEYRSYLFGNEKKIKDSTVPVNVEVIGAVDTVQQVLGVPTTKPYQLTSYKETVDIMKRIQNLGVKNINYKLSGFINGGVRQKLLNKVTFIKQLGGKSGFGKVLKQANDSDAKVYLDATVQFSHRTGFFGGFNRFKDPARFVSSKVCELNEYSPVFYGKDDTKDKYFLCKPSLIQKNVDKLGKKASSLKIDGVSFRDNGYILSSDYNYRNKVSRNKAKDMQIKQFQEMKEKGLSVMINAGNAYALKDVDLVTNFIMHGNDYAIIDKTVPFYQIALHGNVNFAGPSMNISPDEKQNLLEAAESGSALSFTFMEADEKALAETNYSEYYSANFDNWETKFGNIYENYNSKIGKVINQRIDDHQYLSDAVTCTTFENGVKVYVNFGYTDFTTENGLKISARDFKVSEAK